MTARLLGTLVAFLLLVMPLAVQSGAASAASTLGASYAPLGQPGSFPAGGVATYSVTLVNTGTTTWPAGGATPVHLAVHFSTRGGGYGLSGLDATWLTDQRFVLPGDVAPGQSVSLNISVQAPGTAGSYVLEYQLVQEYVAWFPQYLDSSATVVSPLGAAYNPSGQPGSMTTGQSASYAVTVTNTGSQTWQAGGGTPVHLGIHVATTGGGYGASGFGAGSGWLSDQRFALPGNVPAGGTVTLTVSVTAPSTPGGYVLEYQMVEEGVAWFPQYLDTSLAVASSTPTPSTSSSAGSSGVDYYMPATYFTGCPRWTWLMSCYTSSSTGRTAQQQLSSDLAFMAQHGQGSFQRVWVSLDELMYWNAVSGYRGFNPQYLANLDDALARFHARGVKVDLVLLSYAQGASDQYQFHPEALDGNHTAMRSGYLQAVRDFVAHLAANPTDAATVTVMDLENEAYYQLEQYFNTPSHLGTFTSCAATGTVNTSCVDTRIIYPWLLALYQAAHAAAPTFQYTVSDTSRLLQNYSYWNAMYPADVYDIHVYDNAPWSDAGFYRNALALQKPWFAGEAGCASGNTSCTYAGGTSCAQPATCALSVDSWWLKTLPSLGARAVLVEDRSTAWTYPNGPDSQTLTPVGQAVQQMK